MKRVLIPLAEGFEEIEAVVLIDILRRAGAEVVVAGLADGVVTASRGVRVVPDMTLDAAVAQPLAFDAVVLPGGRGGTDRLLADPRITTLVREQAASGRTLAAICAAPEVLHAAGLLDGRMATSHPASESKLSRAHYSHARVVCDGSILTSRAPGTAVELAYALIDSLFGADRVEVVEAGILSDAATIV